jgi:hypothetical protein
MTITSTCTTPRTQNVASRTAWGSGTTKTALVFICNETFSGFFHTENTVSWVQRQALARDDIAGWRMYQAIHAIAWTQNAATTAPAG